MLRPIAICLLPACVTIATAAETAQFINLDVASSVAAPLVAELTAGGVTTANGTADGPFISNIVVFACNNNLTEACLTEIEILGTSGALPASTISSTAQVVLIDAATGAETLIGSPLPLSAAPGAMASASIGVPLPSGSAPKAWRIEARLANPALDALPKL